MTMMMMHDNLDNFVYNAFSIRQIPFYDQLKLTPSAMGTPLS